MKTRTVVLLVLLVMLAAVGSYTYAQSPSEEEPVSQTSTAVIRQRDLLITVGGSGELVAEELPLAFSIPGQISQLNVSPGEMVDAGAVLASLDDSQAELDLISAQLNLQALSNLNVLSQAEQLLLEYQQELIESEETLNAVVDGQPVWYYEMLLVEARANYDTVLQEYQQVLSLSSTDPKSYQSRLTRLSRQKKQALQALEDAQAELEWAKNYQPDSHALALAESQVSLAEARLAAQESLLSLLQGGQTPAAGGGFAWNDQSLALAKARLAVDKAQRVLEQTDLIAPTDGTVTQVSATLGERVGSDPVMTLSVQDSLAVRFYVEETDMAQVSTGDSLEIRLNAYPNLVFEGQVVRIDPALVVVDGSSMAQVWGEFSSHPDVTLFPGMSLEVEVIAEEARQALLVPLQALRQNADGTYFVEVLQPDGSFNVTQVTIGLKDLANVQILSGLVAGDVVNLATE